MTQLINKSFMSLHLLPHGKTAEAFNNRRALALDRHHVPNSRQRKLLRQVFDYVEDTWIESSVWSPTAWSVFMQEAFF